MLKKNSFVNRLLIKFTQRRAGQRAVAALLLPIMLLLAGCGAGFRERKAESETHYKLGVVYLNDRNFIMALEELTWAIEKFPGEASYHNAIGLAYFARDMNVDAKRHMNKAVELKPDFSEAYVNLAAIYLVDGRWNLAIEASESALKNIFYKTPELAYFNIAQANFKMKRYGKAADGFKKSIKHNPRYVPALYNLGVTYEKLSRTVDAVAAFERVIAIAPNYGAVYFKLGMALVKSKQKARAVEFFNMVIELSPGSAEALSSAEYIELLK